MLSKKDESLTCSGIRIKMSEHFVNASKAILESNGIKVSKHIYKAIGNSLNKFFKN